MDVFGLGGTVGQAYTLEGSPGLQDVRVLDQEGNVVASCQCPDVTWRVSDARALYLEVTNSNLPDQGYELISSELELQDDLPDVVSASELPELHLDAPVLGAIEVLSDVDVFTVSGHAGHVLFSNAPVEWKVMSGDQVISNSSLALVRANGGLGWTLPDEGEYHVVVSAGPDGTEDYRFSLLPPNATWNLVPGEKVFGEVALPTQPVLHQFHAEAGVAYSFDIVQERGPSWMALQMRLIDVEGNLLQEDVGAQLSWKASKDGIYLLQISSVGNDRRRLEYSIRSRAVKDDVSDQPNSQAPTLTIGNETNGALESRGDVDVYAFDAVADVPVTFQVERSSVASNSVLSILDSDGETLVSHAGSVLRWTPTATGEAYVAVSGTVPVDYQLTLESTGLQAAPVGGERSDLNRDGVVDFADFLMLSSEFGVADSGGADADLDGDGQVAFADFLIFSQNFGWRDA